jgi:hypothetical protein
MPFEPALCAHRAHSKNAAIHECCYEYIRTILSNFDTELLEKQSKALAASIKARARPCVSLSPAVACAR